jgi:NAD(P)-dependent dehydrogenase (short-subunit alcohol dehydrogenase family)
MELGPWNICVNAICPGSVSGPRIDQVIERDAALRGQSPADIRARYEQQNSLKRFVSADDIAAMVTFLVGPGGVNISGQAIAIDGHTETLA